MPYSESQTLEMPCRCFFSPLQSFRGRYCLRILAEDICHSKGKGFNLYVHQILININVQRTTHRYSLVSSRKKSKSLQMFWWFSLERINASSTAAAFSLSERWIMLTCFKTYTELPTLSWSKCTRPKEPSPIALAYVTLSRRRSGRYKYSCDELLFIIIVVVKSSIILNRDRANI